MATFTLTDACVIVNSVTLSDHATNVIRDGAVRPALARRYLDARIETARRHVVDLTRPVRRALGIDPDTI